MLRSELVERVRAVLRPPMEAVALRAVQAASAMGRTAVAIATRPNGASSTFT